MLTTNGGLKIKLSIFSNIPNESSKASLEKLGKILINGSILNEREGIPIYTLDPEGRLILIKDFVLLDLKGFMKNRIDYFYYGRGDLIVQLRDCIVGMCGDKYNSLETISGIAKPSEANNLVTTAIRTAAIEKLFICDKDESYRFVPKDTDIQKMNISDSMISWGSKTKNGVKAVGEVKAYYNLGAEDQSLRGVAVWYIDACADEVKILHQKSRLSSGLSGNTVFALDHSYHGKLFGHWERGRFIKGFNFRPDAILRDYINFRGSKFRVV